MNNSKLSIEELQILLLKTKTRLNQYLSTIGPGVGKRGCIGRRIKQYQETIKELNKELIKKTRKDN